MGCPVGVGPEVVVKLWAAHRERADFAPVIIGDAAVLARCAGGMGIDLDPYPWRPGMSTQSGRLNVLSVSALPATDWGHPIPASDAAMASYILEAMRLLQAGELAAMVTCPITKTGLNRAGHHYPGHTEMLAALCNTSNFAMMMAGERLKVVLVTIHHGLAQVPGLINRREVARILRLTILAMRRDFGLARPRVAVAGLNPHAGEAGMFGDEEQREITPAIEAVRAEGWEITGPLPPDTVFHKAVAGEFDVVVCMYHDQGLIPFKLLHFADGVNVTLGLPIIRTSVDHGTAYDIAGQGLADPRSLGAAHDLAVRMQRHREEFDHCHGH